MLPPIPVWQRAPILRPLLAMACGILLQRYAQANGQLISIILAIALLSLLAVRLQELRQRYRLTLPNGILAHLIFLALGMQLLSNRSSQLSAPLLQAPASQWIVVLTEYPVEKSASFRVIGEQRAAIRGRDQAQAVGRCLLYFAKDSSVGSLAPGHQLLLLRPLQLLHRTNNPGAFDYRDYCFLQGITHQAYLKPGDYRIIGMETRPWHESLVQGIQRWVLRTLGRYIPGQRERGLAEALLIGYKNDLDRDLVQAYSDTGVVHVIAISGLHLGLIYALALGLTRPLARWRWIRLLVVLAGLWLFALIAGAGPSVLRSAVMFTFLALGPVLDRRTQAINTLALSAFVLLCLDPYWLWDAGFQLSYSAVLSIFLFYRPIYAWRWFPNRMLDFIWQLNAVTIAAQVLTLPVSVFHFHQLPTLFLLTNVLAVPLSSLILLAEILLCALGALPALAHPLGRLVSLLIRWMNEYIERLAGVPFSTWSGLSINALQAVLLTLFLLCGGFYLMRRQPGLARTAAICLISFMVIRIARFREAGKQERLIVYDVGKGRALGMFASRRQWLYADRAAEENPFFPQTIRSAEVLFRAVHDSLAAYPSGGLVFGGRRIYLIDASNAPLPDTADLLLVSGKTKCRLLPGHRIGQVVADATVTAWYADQWKTACRELRIPFHSVRDSGAFTFYQRGRQ